MSSRQRPLPLASFPVLGGTSDGVSAAGCTGRGAPLRAGLLSLLCAVTLGGCGNKGELFLPASPEDERTLERIDTSLDERTPPEAVLPGLPSPTRAPSPDGTFSTEDPTQERDGGAERVRPGVPARPGNGT